MKGFISKVLIEPLRELVQKLVAFLPSLLSGIFVFLAGLVLAWLVKLLVVRIVRLFKLDAALARSGVTEALQKMAVKDTPAKLVGRMFFWLVVFIFSILSLGVMKVPVIDRLLEKLLLYLPNVLVALVILFIGWILSNFLGRAALIASVNAGVRLSGLLSRAVKGVIMLFALVMAFEQLGIGRNTMVAAFAIVFGGAVLALALAFGLGGRDLARTFLEKRMKKEKDAEPDELKHL
jgi:Mechanosensitive ion channel, conserved TM helix